MIISHRHKFVFIKTRKTAGTSMEIALSSLCGPEDVLTPLSGTDEDYRKEISGIGAQNYKIPFGKFLFTDYVRVLKGNRSPQYYNHDTAQRVSKRLGNELWGTYYSFCFERKPENKLISHFQWLRMQGKCTNIQQYVQQEHFQKIRAAKQYLDSNSRPIVDQVFKLEELDTSLSTLTAQLKLEQPIVMPAVKTKTSLSLEPELKQELLEVYNHKLIDYFKFEHDFYAMNETMQQNND
jgi:hypothetical protein